MPGPQGLALGNRPQHGLALGKWPQHVNPEGRTGHKESHTANHSTLSTDGILACVCTQRCLESLPGSNDRAAAAAHACRYLHLFISESGTSTDHKLQWPAWRVQMQGAPAPGHGGAPGPYGGIFSCHMHSGGVYIYSPCMRIHVHFPSIHLRIPCRRALKQMKTLRQIANAAVHMCTSQLV